MRKYKIYEKTAAIVIAAVFAVSCQSIPEKAEMESSAELLPGSSDVVIMTEVQKNRELIEPVLTLLSDRLPPKFSAEFLERTDTLWAGLDFNTGNEISGGAAFQSSIVAEGDYPKGMVNIGLCWNSGWEKQKHSPYGDNSYSIPYWHEKKGENQLAIPSSRYFLASAGSMNEMLDAWSVHKGASLGNEWLESEKDADISIMVRNLSPEDYAAFVPGFERLPLESMLLSLKRTDDFYMISGRFHMDNAVSAFLFTTVFRTLVVSAKNQQGERLFPNLKEIVIEKDENDVVLNGMRLSLPEISAVERKWLGTAGLDTEE